MNACTSLDCERNHAGVPVSSEGLSETHPRRDDAAGVDLVDDAERRLPGRPVSRSKRSVDRIGSAKAATGTVVAALSDMKLIEVRITVPEGMDCRQFICYRVIEPVRPEFPIRKNIGLLLPHRFDRRGHCQLPDADVFGIPWGSVAVGWCPVGPGEKECASIELADQYLAPVGKSEEYGVVSFDLSSQFEAVQVQVGTLGVKDGDRSLIELRQRLVYRSPSRITINALFRNAWVPAGIETTVWCLRTPRRVVVACGRGLGRAELRSDIGTGVLRAELTPVQMVDVEIVGMPRFVGGHSTGVSMFISAERAADGVIAEQPPALDGYVEFPIGTKAASIDVGPDVRRLTMGYRYGRYEYYRWLYDYVTELGWVDCPESRPVSVAIRFRSDRVRETLIHDCRFLFGMRLDDR